MHFAKSLAATAAIAGSVHAQSTYPEAYGASSTQSATIPSHSDSAPSAVPTQYSSIPSGYDQIPGSVSGVSSSSAFIAPVSSSFPVSSVAYGTGSTQSAYQPHSTGYTWPSPPSGPSSPGHHAWPGHPGGYPSGPANHGSPGHPGYPGPPGPGAGTQCPGVQPGKYCLSDSDAEQAADIFRELIQNYSDELALEALTEDFVDYSSSVNIIINGGDGEPLDIEKPTFVGRQEFMDAQGSQPEIPFKKLQRFHGCDSVSMRWLTRRSANGQETETARIPVVGNVIIETVQSSPGDKYNFRIKTIFSEFNAAAWLVNLGVFVPENGTEGDAGNKRSLPANLRGPMF